MLSFLRLFLLLLSIVFIAILIFQTIKHAKYLSNKIYEYHKENEEKKIAYGPINPYEDMASIYVNQSDVNKKDLN